MANKKIMTKEELQAKHRLEEAQMRDRAKERKARTRRLIQEGAVLEKVFPEAQQMELEKLEDERRKSPVLGKRGVPKGIANTEMCTFLIVNISSLQLIPINIIAYRTQYGSTNPTRIVGGAILATTVSTAVGVIFAWVMERVKKV